jgi:acyl-CoA oxidase
MYQLRQVIRLSSISKVALVLYKADSIAYMQNPEAKCRVRRVGDLRTNEFFLECFGHRAAYMVMRALHLRDIEHSSWNSLLVEFYRMSVGI